MRPTLAIIPLALLLSWFGPSPSVEADPAGALGLNASQPDSAAEQSAAQQVAEVWESIQWSGLLPTAAEQPHHR